MTREFDEKNAAKSRSVCEAMAEAANTGKRVMTGRECQILDIWPKFEDGEPVWFGDRYEDWDGLKKEVAAVQFERDERSLLDRDGFHTCFSFGERVKRPVQSALDADGVEVKEGDTVWLKGEPIEYKVAIVIDGLAYLTFKTRNGDNSTVTAYPRNLTHVQPDSWERLEEDAAKGLCEYFGFEDGPCDAGEGCPAYEQGSCAVYKAKDIIRRAKALAGVEVDE